MRRVVFIVFATMAILLACGTYASAQTDQEGDKKTQGEDRDQVELGDLFQWVTDDNWNAGAAFAGMGLVGALVVTFGLIGGAMPGTAGKAKNDADEARIDRMSKRLEDLTNADPVDASAVTAVDNAIDKLRDDTRNDRWRQFALASTLYVVLGGFFAAMLAKDLLQALAIGAGWTALLGTFGLKSDFNERKTAKDEALDNLSAKLKAQAAEPASVELPAEVIEAIENAEVARAF